MKKFVCVVMAFLISLLWCVPAFASQSSLVVSKNSITHEIPKTLYGISLGESNFAGDGGICANLVNNNSFEYKDYPEYAWDLSQVDSVVSTDNPMNKSNPTYETLTIDGRSTITNCGYTQLFDNGKYSQSKAQKGDMGFKKGVTYEFSCYLRNIDFDGSVSVFLDSSSNKSRDINVSISNVGNSWKRVSVKLKSNGTEDGALGIKFKGKGTICLDFVSLVPTNSYGYGDENWENACLNNDFVDAIKNLKPSFVKFAIDGTTTSDGDGNYFSWKNTIGPVEKRKQCTNIKNDYKNGYCYINSNSVGLQEYMQLCSDIGAKPVLVVGAGVKNQDGESYDAHLQALNKTYMDDDQWKEYLKHELGIKGKEAKEYTEYINSIGIKTSKDFDKYINSIALKPNSAKFNNYVQDILDIIEFANGDSLDTYWGSVRAQNGSDHPFGLEYIQIGDENWGDVYWRNFEAIKKAVLAEYPEIKIIASTGSQAEGEIFDSSKSKLSAQSEVFANEHIVSNKEYKLAENANRFDSYTRNSNSIMVGEFFAADDKVDKAVNKNNLYSATQNAAFVTGIERNSDIVLMSSLAPTFAKIDATKALQGLVWFDSKNLVYTPDYYTQMIFANNTGESYVNSIISSNNDEIFCSTTVSENDSSIFVKLVNTSGKKEKISIGLDGFGDISSASYQSVGGKYKTAFNSLKKQTIAPVSEELEYNKNTTQIELMPYSSTVVRIAYGENTGKGFFAISDNINTEVKGYLPMSAKVFVIMMVLIFVLATVVTYFVYSKVVLKGKKFKFQHKNKKNNNKEQN